MDQAAVPRRFWWLKRLAITTVAFGVTVLGLRYLAIKLNHWKLDRDIAVLRAQGEPILPSDFADRPVPQDQNAALDLLEAVKKFHVPDEHLHVWDSLFNAPPYTQPETQTLEAVLSQNQPALAAVRRARGKPVANWGHQMRSPTSGIMLNELNNLGGIVTLLQFAARSAASRGHYDEAFEYVGDLLVISKAIESQPFLVSHLVVCSITGCACDAAIAVMPPVMLGFEGELIRLTSAKERMIKLLIGELLDDRQAPRAGWQWAVQGERMFQVDLLRYIADSGEVPESIHDRGHYDRPTLWAMRPIILAETRVVLADRSKDVVASRAGDDATAQALMATTQGWWRDRLWYPGRQYFDGPQSHFHRHYQTQLRRRQTAVALAERLHELRYGRTPLSVEELMPEFLPQVPLDPVGGGEAKIDLPSRAANFGK